MSKSNTAETGLADGTAVTIGNSNGTAGDAFGTVSTGASQTINYSTTTPMRGTLCYRMDVAAGNGCVVDLIDASASSDFSGRVYVLFESFTTVTNGQTPINFRSSASSLARIESDTTGHLRLVTGAGSTVYSTSALSTNTWYRFEMYGSGFGSASTTCQVDVYVGDNTGTPFITASLSAQTTAATCDRMRIGKVNGSGVLALRFDDIAISAGTNTALGPSIVSLTGNISQALSVTTSVLGVAGAVATAGAAITGGSSVSGQVGAVGAISTSLSVTPAVSGQVGVAGGVASALTIGSTVAGQVGKGGSVTSAPVVTSSVGSQVGTVGAIASSLTVGSSVVGRVGVASTTGAAIGVTSTVSAVVSSGATAGVAALIGVSSTVAAVVGKLASVVSSILVSPTVSTLMPVSAYGTGSASDSAVTGVYPDTTIRVHDTFTTNDETVAHGSADVGQIAHGL